MWRYGLVMGAACLMFLAGTIGCLGLGAEQGERLIDQEPTGYAQETVEGLGQAAEQDGAVSGADAGCTHYVDNRADGEGDGSVDRPWVSVAAHLNGLAPGDVLCIRGDAGPPGRVYVEPMWNLIGYEGAPSGTGDHPITVRSYPGERVVIRSTDTTMVELAWVAHWHFEGLVFDREGKWQYVVHISHADFNTFRDCEMVDGGYEGMNIAGGRGNVIEGCRIHDFDAGPGTDAHGIAISVATDTVIRGNEIYDCTGDGIHLHMQSGPNEVSGTVIEGNHFYTTLGGCSENAMDVAVGNPVIRGNVMHGFRPCDGSCGGTGGSLGEPLVIQLAAHDVLVEGNEIYDCGMGIVANVDRVRVENNVIHDLVVDPAGWTNAALFLYYGSGQQVVNNTVAGVAGNTVFLSRYVHGVTLRNNLFYDTGPVVLREGADEPDADYNGWFNAAGRIRGAHDVVGPDPRFVSPGDYHLRGSSPAVDAGDNEAAPDHDFDGQPRPYGPAVDLGAFELQEPRSVTDLRVTEGVTATNSLTVTLTWTAPGQVGQSSVAHHYELRYDDQVVSDETWSQATVIDANIPAGQPGEAQRIVVQLPWSGSDHLYFALRVFGVDGRDSEVSNPAFWPFQIALVPLVCMAS